MSKIALRQHFQSFAGNAEARVAIVADAIQSAVILSAVHGQYSALLDALSSVDTLKGNAKSVEALKYGIAATGLRISHNGKAVQAEGLRVGKMTEDAAVSLATTMGEAFTLAASTILTTKTVKPAVSSQEVAQKAFAALAGLTARELRKALTGNDARAVLAQLAIIVAEDAQQAAHDLAQQAIIDAQAVTDSPADGVTVGAVAETV